VFALTMGGQWEALRSSHWLSTGIGGRVPPLLEGTMESAVLISLAIRGRRGETCSPCPWGDNGKCFAHFIGVAWTSADVFRRSLGWQWRMLRSLHWFSMGIGGRVPPLLDHAPRPDTHCAARW
jgi:hypothetical protein